MFTKKRAVAGVALAAIGAAAAIPDMGGAQSPGERVITVRDKVRGVAFVHQKKSTKGERLATGDRVITLQAVTSESGASLGKLHTDCVNTGPAAPVFKATIQCLSIYKFKDGQIVASGVVKLGGKPSPFPVIGGSGAYRGVRGEITAGKPVKSFDTVDVIHLDDD